MTGRLTVVGLGPAGPEFLTSATIAAIEAVPPDGRWLRTTKHPPAPAAGTAQSFDSVYDEEPTFEAVYRRIADTLLSAAADAGHVLYAVPGSPRVLERTVDLLVADAAKAGVDIDVVPALSFLDLAWARLGIDPLDQGVRLVDAHQFVEHAAGERGPLLVAHTHNQRVLSDVKLAFEEDEPERAIVLQRLGLADEHIVDVPWAELDRSVEADHLTCVYIPVVGAPVAGEVVRLDGLVRALRERCPWDREQTHETLTKFLLEEAYEVVEAIGTDDEHLEEELGDLLFQVFLHSAIARERGAFTLADVARGVHDKLYARHPHVFGEETVASAAEVAARWEARKREEKGRASVFDGLPSALPSLLYAGKVLRKAEDLGVHVDASPVEGDLGEALLRLVAASRAAGIDPEVALRRAADRVRNEAQGRE